MQIHIVKVGNEDRPASPEDIQDVRKLLQDECDRVGIDPFIVVTHHAVTVESVQLDAKFAPKPGRPTLRRAQGQGQQQLHGGNA